MDNTNNSLFDTDAIEKRLAQLKIECKPRVAEYPARPEDCFVAGKDPIDEEHSPYPLENYRMVFLDEVYDQSLLQELIDYTPKCPIPTDEEQCQQSTTAYYDPKSPYNDFKPGVSYYLDKAKRGSTYWIDMSALAPKGDTRMSDFMMASAMGLVLIKSRQYGRSRQKGGDKI